MYFAHVALCDFSKKILEYRYILQILPLKTTAYAVSADVSRVCEVLVYEEERSWTGVNLTVLRIYSAKPFISLNRLIYCYPPREELAQKEERSLSILRHKFQKHPLTP